MGGEHRADCFTLNGEDVRLDSEWFITPMRALLGVKLERHQAVDTGCNCRLGETRPPWSFAQVVAHDHRIADCGVQARSLAETLL